jgi:hypothetical protein
MLASGVHFALVEYFWKGGDVYMYEDQGAEIARVLDVDFAQFAPEVLKLALHQDARLPVDIQNVGTNTGTMEAIAGFIVFLVGPAVLTSCMVASVASWFGQLCMYRVAREEFGGEDRRAAALGFLFVPSVIFWGAGFTKEALVISFFGPLLLCCYRVLKDHRLGALVGVVVGGVGVAVIKSYTLVAYVVAASAAIYADRAWRQGRTIRIRPVYLVLAIGLAVGGTAATASFFPEYSSEQLADSLAQHQAAWRTQEAGSAIQDVGDEQARSIPEQIAFVPVAIVNAMFRPAFFEVRNAPMAMAAAENALTILVLLGLVAGALQTGALATWLRSPLLVFSVVFVLIFGIGVGLTTSNLGSLSRYRAPMMPFYVTTLLVLRSRSQRAARERAASQLAREVRGRRSPLEATTGT